MQLYILSFFQIKKNVSTTLCVSVYIKFSLCSFLVYDLYAQKGQTFSGLGFVTERDRGEGQKVPSLATAHNNPPPNENLSAQTDNHLLIVNYYK